MSKLLFFTIAKILSPGAWEKLPSPLSSDLIFVWETGIGGGTVQSVSLGSAKERIRLMMTSPDIRVKVWEPQQHFFFPKGF